MSFKFNNVKPIIAAIPESDLSKYMDYLDFLRGPDPQPVSMADAAPYLREEFGLDAPTASAVLSHWMSNFKQRRREATPC